MIALVHPMDQGPSDPSDALPPVDPATLAEAIEAARAEREEQGRVVLERARALRRAHGRLWVLMPAEEDEHLTEVGAQRTIERARAHTAAAEALGRLVDADEDLAHVERRLARLEAEQGTPAMGAEEYARARAAGLADRDDARGAAATMRRGAEG